MSSSWTQIWRKTLISTTFAKLFFGVSSSHRAVDLAIVLVPERLS